MQAGCFLKEHCLGVGPTPGFYRAFPSPHWEEEEGTGALSLTRTPGVGCSGEGGRPGTCLREEASSQAGETLTKEVQMETG